MEARTVAVAMFVAGEAFYLFNCRSLTRSLWQVGLMSNPWIWFGIGAMALLQLAFTYLPAMNLWFETAPMTLGAWVRVLICGWLIAIIVGARKTLAGSDFPAAAGCQGAKSINPLAQ